MIRIISVPTSWGAIVCTLEGEWMRACRLPVLDEVPADELVLDCSSLPAVCRAFLRQLLAGRPAQPSPYQLPTGTPFQRKVWRAMAKIPHGQTMTYGELAVAIGHPGAARAVGGACGANPLPLWLPCHRVVAANNRLGGFSCGLAWKKHLLAAEARGTS